MYSAGRPALYIINSKNMEATSITEVSHSISNYGFMVVTTAVYLLCSATMLILLIQWFVKTVNRIINKQQDVLDEILRLQREQQHLLEEIRRQWVFVSD